MLLHQMLARNADTEPDRVTQTYLDREGSIQAQYSQKQICDRSAELANWLKDEGYSGKTAFLIHPPSPQFAFSFYACLSIGVTSVPLPAPSPGASHYSAWLTALLEDTSADLILSSGKPYEWLAAQDLHHITLIDTASIQHANHQLPMDGEAGSRAAILYTSGSTSAPKGVVLRHEHLVYQAWSNCQCWEIGSQSTLVSWMPNHHSFGLIFNQLLALYAQANLVLFPTQAFVKNPLLWVQTLSRFQGTHSAAATFGYQLCSDWIGANQLNDIDLSSWKVGLVSAEPVRQGVYQQFMDRFKQCGLDPNFFCALYGLSEIGPITSMQAGQKPLFHQKPDAPGDLALACVGPALTQSGVIVIDPSTKRSLDQGQDGEVWITGPSLMDGYLNRPETNAEVFMVRDGVRWFCTGDQGFLKNDMLFITGRIKEIIIVRGKNFYPQDIEWQVKQAHPTLAGCAAAAFETTDPNRRITVLVEAPNGALDFQTVSKQAIELLRTNLGLSIHHLIILSQDQIPKTASGKIKRAQARELLGKGKLKVVQEIHFQSDESQPQTSTMPPEDLIQSLFAKAAALTPEEIHLDDLLADFHLDSIAWLELSEAITAATGKQFHPTAFFKAQTPRDIAEMLKKK